MRSRRKEVNGRKQNKISTKKGKGKKAMKRKRKVSMERERGVPGSLGD